MAINRMSTIYARMIEQRRENERIQEEQRRYNDSITHRDNQQKMSEAQQVWNQGEQERKRRQDRDLKLAEMEGKFGAERGGILQDSSREHAAGQAQAVAAKEAGNGWEKDYKRQDLELRTKMYLAKLERDNKPSTKPTYEEKRADKVEDKELIETNRRDRETIKQGRRSSKETGYLASLSGPGHTPSETDFELQARYPVAHVEGLKQGLSYLVKKSKEQSGAIRLATDKKIANLQAKIDLESSPEYLAKMATVVETMSKAKGSGFTKGEMHAKDGQMSPEYRVAGVEERLAASGTKTPLTLSQHMNILKTWLNDSGNIIPGKEDTVEKYLRTNGLTRESVGLR